jgi:thiol:disulfide interchange protein DsbC
MLHKLTAATLAIAVIFPANAGVKEDLYERFPSTRGAIVEPAFPGFHSVIRGGEVLFVRDDLSIMINGDVMDLKTQTSLTETIKAAHKPKVDPTALPVADAIAFGSGEKKLFVFSDPDCPYCQQLEKSLAQLEDVKVFIFPYPLVTLHPNAKSISESIWCSKDKAKAWRDYLLLGKKPTGAACPTPIERNLALGDQLKVQGTPALIFEDGTVVPGAISLERIQALTTSAHTAAKSKGSK